MLGEQELLSEVFGKLHERVCRLECVFPRIDRGNYEHNRVEHKCAAVAGIQNCGTQKDFDEFLKQIVKHLNKCAAIPADSHGVLLKTLPSDILSITCGVAHLSMDYVSHEQCEVNIIGVRPIVQKKNLFTKILHCIVSTLNMCNQEHDGRNTHLTVTCCGENSQGALIKINKKIAVAKFPGIDPKKALSNFLQEPENLEQIFAEKRLGKYTQLDEVNTSRCTNLTLRNFSAFLSTFGEEVKIGNVWGNPQTEEMNNFENDCASFLGESIEIIERFLDLTQHYRFKSEYPPLLRDVEEKMLEFHQLYEPPHKRKSDEVDKVDKHDEVDKVDKVGEDDEDATRRREEKQQAIRLLADIEVLLTQFKEILEVGDKIRTSASGTSDGLSCEALRLAQEMFHYPKDILTDAKEYYGKTLIDKGGTEKDSASA